MLRLRTEERQLPGIFSDPEMSFQPPFSRPQCEGQGLRGLRLSGQVQANIRRAGRRLSFGSWVRAVAKQAHSTWPLRIEL